MMTKVRGRFPGVAGTIAIGREPETSTVEVTIDMASVQSGSTDRDDHLRSPDFFDVGRHPTVTFWSTGVTWRGHRADLRGDLTICGVSRPVVLAVEYLGATVDPWAASGRSSAPRPRSTGRTGA